MRFKKKKKKKHKRRKKELSRVVGNKCRSLRESLHFCYTHFNEDFRNLKVGFRLRLKENRSFLNKKCPSNVKNFKSPHHLKDHHHPEGLRVWMTEVNKSFGDNSELFPPDECKISVKSVPSSPNLSSPLHHPPACGNEFFTKSSRA